MDLKYAGLTDNESKVYTALVELGPSLAGKISRKTGLHRRTIYDVTETLIQKGLISYILSNNRRVFTAVDPQRILDRIEEQKMMLIPTVIDLQRRFAGKQNVEQTHFFKGKAGMKQVFESQLAHSE